MTDIVRDEAYIGLGHITSPLWPEVTRGYWCIVTASWLTVSEIRFLSRSF
jgi:hypothetical protein